LAGFQVSIIGRFWVSTEGRPARSSGVVSSRPQELETLLNCTEVLLQDAALLGVPILAGKPVIEKMSGASSTGRPAAGAGAGIEA
jgi:hypothetical protein